MNLAAIYNTIGPAGCALVVVGCAGVYIAFRTYFYLALVWRNFQHGFLDLENTGESRCLRNNNSDNPLIAIVRDVVKTHSGHSQDIRAEVAYLFHRNFEQTTKSLCWLRLVAMISPLMGLLGTVLGMVRVFQAIADTATPDPAQLAAGIWEVLITTAMGLSVAIPMLIAYYFLLLKFKGFHIEAVEHLHFRATEEGRHPVGGRKDRARPQRHRFAQTHAPHRRRQARAVGAVNQPGGHPVSRWLYRNSVARTMAMRARPSDTGAEVSRRSAAS